MGAGTLCDEVMRPCMITIIELQELGCFLWRLEI